MCLHGSEVIYFEALKVKQSVKTGDRSSLLRVLLLPMIGLHSAGPSVDLHSLVVPVFTHFVDPLVVVGHLGVDAQFVYPATALTP